MGHGFNAVGECARRPGALPPKRNGCFMVRTRRGPTEYKVAARCSRPRRAPLRLSVQRTPLSGLQAGGGAIQTRYVTQDKVMPRGCKSEGERALSNAERQARHRARQHDRMPVIRYRRPTDRRGRAQRGAMPSTNWSPCSPSMLRGSTHFPTAFAARQQERRYRLSQRSTSTPWRPSIRPVAMAAIDPKERQKNRLTRKAPYKAHPRKSAR